MRGTVPAEWAGRTVEAVIDLGFDANMPGLQCEGLVYRPDGSPVKGINPNNQWVRVADAAAGGEQVELHVEAAANPVVLDYHRLPPTEFGDKQTAGASRSTRIARLDLAVFDENVWNLALDLEVLGELMAELSTDEPGAGTSCAPSTRRPGRARSAGRGRHRGRRARRARARARLPRRCPRRT